jgi:NAD(P)-dependent dehydrogenase (short-subunit alcohol dehydrogenase family)
LSAESLFSLDGKAALVSGGASGIGLAMAEALAAAGSDVCVWGRSPERNRAAIDRIGAHGTRVHALACELSSADDVERVFGESVDLLGRLDICVANAGVDPERARFPELDAEDWDRVIAVNLTGTMLTFRAAARQMIEQGDGGSLIATSSLASLLGMARKPHYAASKAGVNALVRALAVELAPDGIRANSVLPGWVETPMTDGTLTLPAFQTQVLPRIPMKRWGEPADMAGIIVYLASDASSYHTGDAFVIDGGYSLI